MIDLKRKGEKEMIRWTKHSGMYIANDTYIGMWVMKHETLFYVHLVPSN